MSGVVIHAEGLSKRYQIGSQQASYQTLRETIMNMTTAPMRRVRSVLGNQTLASVKETIWALEDVSFEVRQGESVGIIGRNGAGKTTLLKILSRITKPTKGRVILEGRVGSLLEVGTGFHPELTGRENIYLNGAILGMRKIEIERKFDEIVAFAELEKFLDTPVKHFSSGMYVRLAFSVAAHLEPEILLVDEVLAVGDVSFQRKCLGKMGEISSEGRTVLFVSHNMGAIVSLCERSLWIHDGQLLLDGRATEVTAQYLASNYHTKRDKTDLTGVDRYGNGQAQFVSIHVTPFDENGNPQPHLSSGQDLEIRLRIRAYEDLMPSNIAVIIYDSTGYRLVDINTAIHDDFLELKANQEAEVSFRILNVLLKSGVYLIGLWLGRRNVADIDGIQYATSLSVEPDLKSIEHVQEFPGVYQCRFQHNITIDEMQPSSE